MTCPHQSRAGDHGQFTCAIGKHGGKPWAGQCAACMNPTASKMVANLGGSIANFAKSGFKKTDPETLVLRESICRQCDFWNAQSVNKTGRCRVCGCSTWAKLRMASESCPIGKW